jgi:hypothetical protein
MMGKDTFHEELHHIFDQFHEYHMKMLGDFDAKVDREDVFKTTTGNTNLHKISKDNEVRIVNFATCNC